MTIPITLENLASLENETTAISVINTNSATITSTFGSALDTGGDQMEGNLDMNSNRVLNLPTPASNFEPIRFVDAGTLGTGGTITLNPLPAGGTTGQSLVKNSNANFDAGWQTLGNVPQGGAAGQVLVKNTSTNFDTGWENAVTSVGISPSADFAVTNSPITTTGNIGIGFASTPTGTGVVVKQNSPTINNPAITQIQVTGNTLTLPAASDTLVGRNTVDTLTNKSIAVSQLIGSIPAGNFPQLVGDVTTPGGTLTTSISSNAVTNGQLAPMTAFSLKGNATASSANPTDIVLSSLTNKASPVSADLVLIADSAASGALKNATLSAITSVGSVASVGGLTGAITLGSGLATGGSSILADPAFIGEIRQLAFNRIPANFLACNGAQISRTTFASLFAALVASSVVTITNASPAVITWTGNQLQNGDPIILTTSGSLPTGFATATKYYVKGLSGNTFNLATTPGGTVVNTSSAGSGTQTAFNAPWEGTTIGNGSTTFTVPSLNGQFIRGIDNAAGVDTNRSFGTSQAHAFQTHTHAISDPGHAHTSFGPVPGGGSSFFVWTGGSTTSATQSQGGTSSSGTGISVSSPNSGNVSGVETRPVNNTCLYVIRYQ